MIPVKHSSAGGIAKEPTHHTFRVLTLTTLIATYLLIVLGSTVRVTESGMGCNGWPLCSGQIGPIDQFHPLLEQSHRYLASIVTILIFSLAIVTWRSGPKGKHLRPFAIAGVGLIVVQVALGAITVVTNNAPITVALHLIVGLLFLAVITATTVRAFLGEQSRLVPRSEVEPISIWALTGLFFVLISGSLVVNGEAEKSCPSWPACFGSQAPGGLVDLQLIHRLIVLVGAVLVASYAVHIFKRKLVSRPQHYLAITAAVLLILQIALGAIVALLKAPDSLADIHLAMAAALWSVVVAMVTMGAFGDHELATSASVIE